jgi:hypothetical protein
VATAREDAAPDDGFDIGWLLRHPNDHWLRYAACTVSDLEVRAVIAVQTTSSRPAISDFVAWIGQRRKRWPP